MSISYRQINYEEISPLWDILWPNQEHNPYSSMCMLGGTNVRIRDMYKWRAWGAFTQANQLIGCNAGHKSGSDEYRTRGLWVSERHRGMGIAQQLFARLELQAKNEQCRWLWSYPRLASLPAYQKAGYQTFGDTDRGEWDDCVRAKKDLSLVTTTVWNLFENPLEDELWLKEIDILDKQGILLGQNEEVRGNHVHITQLWCNDKWCQPHSAIGEKNPLKTISGDLSNSDHVLT